MPGGSVGAGSGANGFSSFACLSSGFVACCEGEGDGVGVCAGGEHVTVAIEDIAARKQFLEKYIPEVKVGVAHGQMPARELEDIMSAFYDGKFDVLLSTTIVESGLDIPTANTLIVHRADRFGLAQLYQLRGRVGRSKTRAYAILTTPGEKPVTVQAERRLKVLQSLDSLGAGFELASHDLDIRGAGNLLGEEQSGHIREVGYELYQEMLAEAVAALEAGIDHTAVDKWSPQIAVGTPVMIPEEYVPDLSVRLGAYRALYITRFALAEAPALFAIIFVFVTGSKLIWLVVLIALISFVTLRPGKERLIKELDLSSDEISKLEGIQKES